MNPFKSPNSNYRIESKASFIKKALQFINKAIKINGIINNALTPSQMQILFFPNNFLTPAKYFPIKSPTLNNVIISNDPQAMFNFGFMNLCLNTETPGKTRKVII